ncbi:MAG: hypothetical protein KAS87_03035 [Candidatus Omnitrophica bacterium]|nr:hypothetical protein [Candidatus Omnitrophota bacterium]
MMKVSRKKFGILILLGVLSTGIVLMSGCSKGPEELSMQEHGLALINTYSKYGLSFKYPSGMKISEIGMLEKTLTENSGQIVGKISKKNVFHILIIAWQKTEVSNIDDAMAGALGSMERQGVKVNIKEKGELIHKGYKVTYQIYEAYGKAKEGPDHIYGIFGIWYCDQTKKRYVVNIMYDKKDVLPLFQKYLDSFACH